MPTFQVVAPCHKDSVLNSAFASDYGDLISNDRIDVWIYGHSHTNIDAEIGGTEVLSNQMGYVFQNEHLMNGYQQRTGKIARKDFNRIEPRFRIESKDRETSIKALEDSVNGRSVPPLETMKVD